MEWSERQEVNRELPIRFKVRKGDDMKNKVLLGMFVGLAVMLLFAGGTAA